MSPRRRTTRRPPARWVGRSGNGRRPLSLWQDGLLAVVIIAALVFVISRLPGENADGVARIIDGDSLFVSGREVRLYGIDAPELAQGCEDANGQRWACGRAAREALRVMTNARTVKCVGIDQDRYGRLVARCMAGERDLGEAMVAQGFAIAYRAHSLDYITEETAAEAARRGVWRGRFQTPAEWRKANKAQLVGGEE